MTTAVPPLGEVAVDVTVRLARLEAGFAEGLAKAARFDQALNQGVSRATVQAQRLTDQLGQSQMRLARNFQASSAAADRYSRDIARARVETERTARSTESSVSSMRRTLIASAGTIAAAFGAREIMRLADGYTSFTNRLRSAGDAGQVLAMRQQALFDIAQRYGVELEAVGSLYGRLSQAQNDLGASTAQIMQTVEGAAAAVRVYGAGTQEQAGAIRQLSQMLGNAKVQMQEFNSLNDGARPILQAVARGIDRFHGSVSQLRAEVMRGGFDTKEFFEGMQRGLPAIIQQANEMPLTIGASFQVLSNALGQYIGQTDHALSATQRVGAGIRALAENLDTLMPILTAIVLAIGARYVSALTAATVATIRRIAVDTTAAVAANALATTQGRVTTTMGVSTIATGVYSGSLEAVTLTANAATAGLTRMQIVMATGAAVARTAGSAMLAAFGGWVGVAIMAVVGSVYLYYRATAQAAAEVENFNQRQLNAVDILQTEAARAHAASGEIRNLGEATRTTTTRVQAFAGATGDLADQLFRQAVAARKARLETIYLGAELLEQSAREASARASSRADTLMRSRVPVAPADDPEWQEANRRAQDALRTAGQLREAARIAIAQPLESELGPNRRTEGRNLEQEIIQRRAQLLVAERNHNEALQRQLLAEIKLRERIVALMATGLNFENAQAQANAEALRAPRASSANRSEAREVAFINPVAGRISSGYGPRRAPIDPRTGARGSSFHPALDFPVPEGTSVRAPAAGVIIRTGRNGALGNVVWIDHGNGVISELNHLRLSNRTVGEQVAQGDNVGLSGQTGTATGPHLDWRVRTGASAGGTGGRYVNPSRRRFSIDPGDAEANAADSATRDEEERIRNERQFTDELAAINREIVDARRGQTVDEAQIAEMDRERVGIERDRQRAEIESRFASGQYTEAQRDQALVANEDLRTLQLSSIGLRERERQIRESLRVATATHDREMEVLQAQQDLARTAAERRAVERRILRAQEEQERRALQAIIDSPTSSPVDVQIATADKARLGDRYQARRGTLDRQSRDDMMGMDRDMGGDRARRAAIQEIRDQEEERKAIIKEALEARLISAQEGAERLVEIERDAHLRIMEIESQRNSESLRSASETFGSLAEITKAFAGEQSGIYKAMFIASKAFAIAEAIVQIQLALSKALALGFPQNIPAIASVAALGASIVANMVSAKAAFYGGGYTGDGDPRAIAGAVHHGEYVFDHRSTARIGTQALDSIRAGRDPGSAMRRGGGGAGLMGRGGMKVTLINQAKGIEHDVRETGPGEMEIIARRIVRKEAPGVVAADLANPAGKVSKAVARHTTARRDRR